MNPTGDKRELLPRCRRIIVKLGSAVLTVPGKLDLVTIHRLSDQVAELRQAGAEVLLVSSGAVAAGVARVARPRPRNIPEKQAAAALGQSLLMQAWEEGFRKHDLHVAQVLLTADDLAHRHRYLNARHTLETLLEWGVLPVINENDTVAVDEIKFGDNDQLAALIAGLVGADLVILLTDTPGFYDKNPRMHDDAKRFSLVEELGPAHFTCIDTHQSDVGTGGMRSKLEAAHKCMESGIPMVIADGKARDILRSLMEGRDLGTLFLPQKRRFSGKKLWIAHLSKPEGELHLDAGAARALKEQGRSLLPVGIASVQGSFPVGAPVRCIGPQHEMIGVGLTNYSSQEIHEIKGCQSDQIAERIGYHHSDAVVHRNTFVLADSLERSPDE